jgi:hypothetical protein
MSEATMHERALLVIAVVGTLLLAGCRMFPQVQGFVASLTSGLR